jgi:hypothetical protein
LIVTTILLLFHALKEKEVLMVEEVPTETPSRDHHEIVVDVEVANIASENLTCDDAEEEERAEV